MERILTESLCQSESRIHSCSLLTTDCLTPGFPVPSLCLSERMCECSCTQLCICEKVLSVGVWSHRMRHTMAMVILVLNNAAHTKWDGQRKSQKEKAQRRENERSVNRVCPCDELCTSTHLRLRTIIDHRCIDQ